MEYFAASFSVSDLCNVFTI